MRRRSAPLPEPEVPWPEVDVNQVVAYNVRQARELRGWTQEDLAERLEPYLGQRLTQAAVSSIERAWDGERRREFDAHELLIFALVFDLPIVWFFLPPAGDRRMMRATTRPVAELYDRLLGLPHQLEELHARLREYGMVDPDSADEVVERLTGAPSGARRRSYEHRRKEMLLALLDDHADELDVAFEDMGRRFDHFRATGIRGFVAQHTNDSDYVKVTKAKPATDQGESPAGGADEAARGGSGAKAPRKRSNKKR